MGNIFDQMRKSDRPWEHLLNETRKNAIFWRNRIGKCISVDEPTEKKVVEAKPYSTPQFAEKFALKKFEKNLFLLDKTSLVDQRILERNNWENKQRDFLRNATKIIAKKPGSIFLDIGAYWGLYSYLAKDMGFSEIHMFEADRNNHNQLCAQLFLNDAHRDLHLHNVAVSDCDGSVLFNRSEDHLEGNRGNTQISEGQNPNAYEVASRAIDAMFSVENRNIVVKLDVEGHEVKVIQGMKNMLKNNKVFLQIEAFPDCEQKLVSEMKSHGYWRINKINVDHYFTNFDPFSE